MTTEKKTSRQATPAMAVVAKVLNEYRVIINRGSSHGIEGDETYLIYEVGEEIKDPETGEILGRLEITKGRGRIINVQEKMSTIETIMTSKAQKQGLVFYPSITGLDQEVVKAPFDNAKVGDKAKLIS